jgi:hypothetical protein
MVILVHALLSYLLPLAIGFAAAFALWPIVRSPLGRIVVGAGTLSASFPCNTRPSWSSPDG